MRLQRHKHERHLNKTPSSFDHTCMKRERHSKLVGSRLSSRPRQTRYLLVGPIIVWCGILLVLKCFDTPSLGSGKYVVCIEYRRRVSQPTPACRNSSHIRTCDRGRISVALTFLYLYQCWRRVPPTLLTAAQACRPPIQYSANLNAFLFDSRDTTNFACLSYRIRRRAIICHCTPRQYP